MRYKTVACLLLAVITLGVYLQVSGNGFIIYDDPAYVTGNAKIKGGMKAEAVVWAFTSSHAANWHPLTWLSHIMDVQFFGLDPKWHHLMSVFLHLANAGLLFLLLGGMTAAWWQSLFVAALFALHPLHVESVAWVSERKDVLSTLFFFLTLLSYCRYVKNRNRSGYHLALCVFALGLMAKPMLVTLPFVLLLLDFWPFTRAGFSQTEMRAWKRLFREKIPFFTLSAASCIVTIYAQSKAVATLKGVPFIFRCVNALMAYVYYLGKMFWPFKLSVIYPLPATWTVVQGAEAFLLLTGITAGSIVMARRHPYLLVGWLWYLGTLVPVIGLVQVGKQFIADRYTYIPLIGVFIMIAWGVPELVRGRRYGRIALSSAAGLVLLASAAGTWVQLGYWKDSITLFRHAIDVYPDNYVARNILGSALSDAGRIEEAISQFSEVLRVWPEDAEAHIGIGLLLAERGKIDEGIEHFHKVLRVNPEDVEAHHNLGVALVKQGKLEEAIGHFREALRLRPDLDQAATSLEAAYRLKKDADGR